MKNGFRSQFERLIRKRFQERDRQFSARLLKVKREHSRWGILTSSTTVGAMYAELEREFKESTTECVEALVDAMENRPTALPDPWKRTILRLCSDALSERRATLDATYQGASAIILASLNNRDMTAPYRSLSDNFVQVQRENAFVELRKKKRELFWLNVRRMRMLLLLAGAVIGAVVAAASYLGRDKITEMWTSLLDRVLMG